MPQGTYADLMTEGTSFVELRIDLERPADLVDLVGAFSAVASQFEQFIRREHPNLKGDARLFVKDIRHGSIVVELIPVILPLIENMDRVLIVDGFVRRFGGLLASYSQGDKKDDISKSEIKDLMGAVTLIANDPNGTSAISSVEYHKTKATTRINIEFDTAGAKKAKELLQIQKAALELPSHELFENKMLVFVRTTVKPSETGKRTDLKGLIEAAYAKPLAITFETDTARQRIEDEIREDEKNVYKKGFFVDAYMEKLQGKPAAYRIVSVRDIIPLPEDD